MLDAVWVWVCVHALRALRAYVGAVCACVEAMFLCESAAVYVCVK